MDWYYADKGERLGPVDETEFKMLSSTGIITPETLVWRQGMPEWQRHADLSAPSPGAAPAQYQQSAMPGHYACAECGLMFPMGEMVRYQNYMVCATCKPVFFQRLREGAPLPFAMAYAGFWIRFAAKIIDGIILYVFNMIIQFGLGAIMSMGTGMNQGEPSPLFFAYLAVLIILQIGIPIGYVTYFIGKYAATPGKMACGLKVVLSNGGALTYTQALGRGFAEILSAIIFYVGYIMAGFDDEKRALHDRICNTRVIRS